MFLFPNNILILNPVLLPLLNEIIFSTVLAANRQEMNVSNQFNERNTTKESKKNY